VVDDEGFMPLHLATVLCSHFHEHSCVLQARFLLPLPCARCNLPPRRCSPRVPM
jgi:hypothetical protein